MDKPNLEQVPLNRYLPRWLQEVRGRYWTLSENERAILDKERALITGLFEVGGALFATVLVVWGALSFLADHLPLISQTTSSSAAIPVSSARDGAVSLTAGTSVTPIATAASTPASRAPDLPSSTETPRVQANTSDQQSDDRISALRAAAANWMSHSGLDAGDFLAPLAAITEGDIARFSPADKVAWTTLQDAQQLTNWKAKGFTASTRLEIPMVVEHVDEASDLNLTSDLGDLLRAQHYNVVSDPRQAAFFVELSDVSDNSQFTPHPEDGKNFAGTATATVSAAFLGDNRLVGRQDVTANAQDMGPKAAALAARNQLPAAIADWLLELAR